MLSALVAGLGSLFGGAASAVASVASAAPALIGSGLSAMGGLAGGAASTAGAIGAGVAGTAAKTIGTTVGVGKSLFDVLGSEETLSAAGNLASIMRVFNPPETAQYVPVGTSIPSTSQISTGTLPTLFGPQQGPAKTQVLTTPVAEPAKDYTPLMLIGGLVLLLIFWKK